jgi:hypothetical protein
LAFILDLVPQVLQLNQVNGVLLFDLASLFWLRWRLQCWPHWRLNFCLLPFNLFDVVLSPLDPGPELIHTSFTKWLLNFSCDAWPLSKHHSVRMSYRNWFEPLKDFNQFLGLGLVSKWSAALSACNFKFKSIRRNYLLILLDVLHDVVERQGGAQHPRLHFFVVDSAPVVSRPVWVGRLRRPFSALHVWGTFEGLLPKLSKRKGCIVW